MRDVKSETRGLGEKVSLDRYFSINEFGNISLLNQELEKHRIVNLESTFPHDIQKIIENGVDKALNSAILIKPEQYGKGEVGPNTIALRLPEDSHLCPLVEKILFDKLMKLRRILKSENKFVDERALMYLDPKISNMVTTLFPGRLLRGETLFEHEVQHAYSVKDQTGEDSFVFLSFVWIQKDKNMELSLYNQGGVLDKGSSHQNMINEVLMAPRNPSAHDFLALDADGLGFVGKMFLQMKSIYGIVFAELAQKKLLYQWKKENPIL